MCGIAGFRAIDDQSSAGASDTLTRMLDPIVHRGPDHRGVFGSRNVFLGNQRLKIIDLEGGNQPIYNEDKSVVVVYNGEIYNYRELRKELEALGHQFYTASDTEVLVHLYEEYDLKFLERLNGIFALALYDQRKDRLVLARDRFGIKPLFYAENSRGLFFASEISALKRVSAIQGDLDFEALSIYLYLGYIPQPWSAFKSIKRLEAGSYLVSEQHSLTKGCYYQPRFLTDESMDFRAAKEQTVSLLRQAVCRQLVSDVPVGMFLSSGLDSFSILAFAAEAGSKLDSFTLSFSEGEYDEAKLAEQAASSLGCKHTRVALTDQEFVTRLNQRLSEVTEPLGAWINVGKKLLAETAYARGIKVVFNGAGGDELFCGYPTINAAYFSRTLSCLPESFRKIALESWVGLLPAGSGALPISFLLKSFVAGIDPDRLKSYFNFKRPFSTGILDKLLSKRAKSDLAGSRPELSFSQYHSQTQDLNLIDSCQFADIKCFLEGSILFWGDSATMAASVEERVPFLDNDLVDFALTIPKKIKFHPFRVKSLLKKSLSDYFSSGAHQEFIRSYRKRGFGLPANEWIRAGAGRKYIEERFSSEKLLKTGFFEPAVVRALMDEHFSGAQNHHRMFQVLLGLENFLEGVNYG